MGGRVLVIERPTGATLERPTQRCTIVGTGLESPRQNAGRKVRRVTAGGQPSEVIDFGPGEE
jgi:hypothetical protein